MAGQVLYPVSPYAHPKPPGDMSGGGGIMDLMRAASPPKINQGQVNTGTDAQGNPTFDITPASLGGGFFNRLMAGRQGQMQVNQANSALQIEKLRALSDLAGKRTEGEQTRKTHITDAQIAMLQGIGLMPRTSPDGSAISADLINAVASKTEQPNLDAAGAKSQSNRVVSEQSLNTLNSPQGQKAITDSTIGQTLMPAINAQKASQVQAAPGETVAYNPFNNLMGNRPDILTGASTSSTTSAPMQVPIKDAKGNITGFGVQTFPTGSTSQQPGSLQQQISPDIIQQAAGMQESSTMPSPTGVQTDPTLGMQFAPQASTSSTSMIPNKPNPMPDGNPVSPDFGALMQMIIQKISTGAPNDWNPGLVN